MRRDEPRALHEQAEHDQAGGVRSSAAASPRGRPRSASRRTRRPPRRRPGGQRRQEASAPASAPGPGQCAWTRSGTSRRTASAGSLLVPRRRGSAADRAVQRIGAARPATTAAGRGAGEWGAVGPAPARLTPSTITRHSAAPAARPRTAFEHADALHHHAQQRLRSDPDDADDNIIRRSDPKHWGGRGSRSRACAMNANQPRRRPARSTTAGTRPGASAEQRRREPRHRQHVNDRAAAHAEAVRAARRTGSAPRHRRGSTPRLRGRRHREREVAHQVLDHDTRRDTLEEPSSNAAPPGPPARLRRAGSCRRRRGELALVSGTLAEAPRPHGPPPPRVQLEPSTPTGRPGVPGACGTSGMVM